MRNFAYGPKNKLSRIIIVYNYMAVAASGPNTEILQFDWLIGGRIFPVLPAQEGI